MKQYRICSKTIMDTSDTDITFDENGICNHVYLYEENKKRNLIPDAVKQSELNRLISQIKKDGAEKEYDCIIGLSGGADSSYVAYLVKKFGLRPLAVHLDNGWNSELAVHNIEKIVKTLDFDLYTYVIDWEEFKSYQKAFLKASVVDIEMLTDNAIVVLLDRLGRKFGIKHFISGTNVVTEGIMPRSWFYDVKYDSLNIRSIHKLFGDKLKKNTYPIFTFFEYVRFKYFTHKSRISILNYVEYNKSEVVKLLEKELGWRDYGGKHWESKFTQFYQAYILPNKFNIDKRRAFLSCLILSGQITRETALDEIQKPLYSEFMLKEDIEYFIKKFNFTEKEFEEFMRTPPINHSEYPSYDRFHKKLVKIYRFFVKRK